MNCTRCGNPLPPGTAQCPICGAWVDTTQQDYFQNRQGMQQGAPPADGEYGFAASDAQTPQNKYATPAFHTYRKQMLTGFPQSQQSNYTPQARGGFQPGSAILKALSDLPQVIRGTWISPTGTLQGMIRRDDRVTGAMLAALSVILAFLTGMILASGMLGILFSAMSGLTGIELADNAASLNQGINYLSDKIALSVGGVAAVCQLIAVLVPVMVTMAYLGVLRQVKLSFLMVSGVTAILLLPNLLALLLAAVLSLITPYLALLALFFGQIISYILLCTMAVQIAEIDAARTVPVQASLVCISELLKLLLTIAVGGALMGSVMQTLTGLTHSVSGLL